MQKITKLPVLGQVRVQRKFAWLPITIKRKDQHIRLWREYYYHIEEFKKTYTDYIYPVEAWTWIGTVTTTEYADKEWMARWFPGVKLENGINRVLTDLK